MGEIKLRAWDEGKRVMHYDFQFIKSGDEGNDWIVFVSDKKPLNADTFKDLDAHFSQQLKVMRYTGFKATKGKVQFLGKGIYECDIFRQTKEDQDEYYVVMWINERGAFYLIPIDHYSVLRDNDCSMEPEFEWLFRDAALYDFSIDCGLAKVGNIYENPELLK